MAAEVNGHVPTEDGETRDGDTLFRCVECGKRATSWESFKWFNCEEDD